MPLFGELRNLWQMDDTTIAALVNGQILVWNAALGVWVNQGAPAGAGGQGDYMYLVQEAGGNYTVYSNVGATVHGPVASYSNAAQWAINNLTAARTWKERVVLRGNCIIDGQITYPSHLIYDRREAICTVNNVLNLAGNPIETNANHVAGNTRIEIINGILNSNYPTNNNANYGISFVNCNNIKVKSAEINTFRNYGVQFNRVDDSYIQNNRIVGSADDVNRCIMKLIESDNNLIENNKLLDNWIELGNLGSVVSCLRNKIVHNDVLGINNRGMIRVYTKADHTLVEGNTIIAQTAAVYGIACKDLKIIANQCFGQGTPLLADDLISLAAIEDLLVSENELYNPNKNGINVDNPVATLNANMRILGNYVEAAADGSGIRIQGPAGGIDLACTIGSNQTKNSSGNHILVMNINGVVIKGNNCYTTIADTTTYGINVDLCNDAVIKSNTIWGIKKQTWSPGIYFDDCLRSLIKGNTVHDCGCGVRIDGSHHNIISCNSLYDHIRYGIWLNDDDDFNDIFGNQTDGNLINSIMIGNANCDNNKVHDNTLEDGAINNAGTNTRAWLNYDPSINAFLATINPPTIVGGGGGVLP